jgi:hypothetical protein
MGVSGQLHAPAALYPFRYPLNKRLGGPRASLDAGARRKILRLCRGSNPDRLAHSRTRYCLSYRGSQGKPQISCKLTVALFGDRSRGSSGGIVSDYGLDDRAIEVRSPTGADFSSSPWVQTGSGAHPASYPMGTMGTGGSFPGVKRGRGVTLTIHPHLVPRLRMSRSYASSSPMCLHGV